MNDDEFYRCERIRVELDVLMSKASLGDYPIMGGDSLYEYEHDKPEYEKFIDLRKLLHGNRHCHSDRYAKWPKNADGLLYFFISFGKTGCEMDINGISFVTKKINKLPHFREQKQIILLLNEFSSRLATSASL